MDIRQGIANLNKWTEKTVELVRRVCNKKKGPCVGIAMLFVTPDAPPGEQWNYVIELAFDPHNPPDEKEKENLTKSFEHIMGGVAQILQGALDDGISEFTARGDLH